MPLIHLNKWIHKTDESCSEVSIGLPRVLVEEKNQILILTIFSIVLLFAVPMAFIAAHMRQKKSSAEPASWVAQ